MKIKIVTLVLMLTATYGAKAVAVEKTVYPKFSFPVNPITLERAIQPWTDFTVVGRKAFAVGKENGSAEVWLPPLKILHDLNFWVIRAGTQYDLELAKLARYIWVRPEATTIRFVHSAFTIDATFFAPIESAGIALLLDIQSSEPLTLLIRFQSDLQPMWPAGLGGQFSYWEEEEHAFIISESRWQYAGVIGSPFASAGSSTPAHAQPEAPVQFKIEVVPDSICNQFIPIVVAGSVNGLNEARQTYHYILSHLDSLYQLTYNHYRRLRQDCLTAQLPEPKLALALEWAKVALDQGLIDNPQLGRGLVAGFGPSGKSARPGFAWFFGGDAFINSWAINDYGDRETVQQALRFLIRYQRQDGKITHEISQSAAMIPWFDKYPYAYYHADTTPYFLVAMDDYLCYTGDATFIKANWPAIQKAFDYCLSADSNQDGLMDNLKAGLGAVELGKLRSAQTEVDIYLAGIWTAALDGMVRLADANGHERLSQDCRRRLVTAQKVLNQKFWQQEKQTLSFALLTDGTTIDDITPWQTVPLCFNFITPEHADAMMASIEQPELSTDWGVRFLAKSSPKYQYWGYNTGAVWPFTTLFAIWGGFEAHHYDFAQRQWRNLAALTFTQQLGAIAELFSGDRFQPLEEAVPHQLFSSTPVIVGFARGILGLQPNVPQKTLTFAPHWPRQWTTATIDNIPFGQQRLALRHSHDATQIQLIWQKSGIGTIRLQLSYGLLPDENVISVLVNDKPQDFLLTTTTSDRHLCCEILLEQPETQILLQGVIRVDPVAEQTELKIGATQRQ